MTGATWLVSYPRSGNTWARFALMSALNPDTDGELDQLDGFARAALNRGAIDRMMESDSGYLTHEETLQLRSNYHKARFAGAAPSPIVKVHDKCQALASGAYLHPREATHAAIYLVRDPREIVTSWASFMGRSIDWAIKFLASSKAAVGQHADRISMTMPEHLGSWSEHVTSWIDNAPYPVTIIRYEDMLTAPDLCLARMVETAGYAIGPEDIRRAVRASDFNRLASLERDHGFRDRPGTADRFFRSGRASTWRDVLTAEQEALIVAAHGPTMKRFGYLFDDDETSRSQALDKF